MRPGAVLLASKRSRAYLRDIVQVRGDDVRVLAHEEISPRYDLVQVGAIELVGEVERAALAHAVI